MTFPKARGRGYDIDEVEEFLEVARRSFTGGQQTPHISSESIRQASFTLRRGGYSVNHVDEALDRLEDAFATKQQPDSAEEESGALRHARSAAQEIVNRLSRPKRYRFDRAGFMVDGYHRADVDALADDILGHLISGEPLQASEVRTAAFRPQRGGYREAQVDLLLDTVIAVMLAVR